MSLNTITISVRDYFTSFPEKIRTCCPSCWFGEMSYQHTSLWGPPPLSTRPFISKKAGYCTSGLNAMGILNPRVFASSFSISLPQVKWDEGRAIRFMWGPPPLSRFSFFQFLLTLSAPPIPHTWCKLMQNVKSPEYPSLAEKHSTAAFISAWESWPTRLGLINCIFLQMGAVIFEAAFV